MNAPRTCKVRGCSEPHSAKGLCHKHYNEHHARTNPKRCAEEGCDERYWARGYCLKHYNFHVYHGNLPKKREEDCQHEECDDTAVVKGYCRNHYFLLTRNGLLEVNSRHGLEHCTVEGCATHVYAKGLCRNHYHQDLRRRKKDAPKKYRPRAERVKLIEDRQKALLLKYPDLAHLIEKP